MKRLLVLAIAAAAPAAAADPKPCDPYGTWTLELAPAARDDVKLPACKGLAKLDRGTLVLESSTHGTWNGTALDKLLVSDDDDGVWMISATPHSAEPEMLLVLRVKDGKAIVADSRLMRQPKKHDCIDSFELRGTCKSTR